MVVGEWILDYPCAVPLSRCQIRLRDYIHNKQWKRGTVSQVCTPQPTLDRAEGSFVCCLSIVTRIKIHDKKRGRRPVR